jgi:hypothetical protein
MSNNSLHVSRYQAQHSLLLYPNDPNFSLPQQQLIQLLNKINLLGKAETEQRFLVGERFLSLFCFMGCSPHIELYPQEHNQPYCYIEVAKTHAKTQCVISQSAKIPLCPHCKQALAPMVQQLQQRCVDKISCPHCAKTLIPQQLNWRKTAFFAKTHIVIGNIYEAEALPDQQFLDYLEDKTQVIWKYAYIRTL